MLKTVESATMNVKFVVEYISLVIFQHDLGYHHKRKGVLVNPLHFCQSERPYKVLRVFSMKSFDHP